MQADELDNQLDELEIRVERLRSLYEQYFMGIEKLEPAVPRKDVDRRIWVLRRTQIRNTAKRFRLHNIIQRYNTFQQYWQRICREIENGTYTRHLARAVRRLGEEEIHTIAARRRFGQKRPADTEEPPQDHAATFVGVEAELEVELRRLSVPPPAEDEFDLMLRSLAPSAPPLLPVKTPPRPTPSKAPPLPSKAPTVSLRAADSLRVAPAQPEQIPSGLMPAVVVARSAARPEAQVRRADLSVPPPLPVRASRVPPTQQPAGGPRPEAALRQDAGPGPRNLAPRVPLPPTEQPQTGPVGIWTAPGDPKTRTRPLPSLAAPPEPKRSPAIPTAVSPEVRDLHTQLMRARDQTGDQTRVSVEALAKTLDATRAKLREQHGLHRKIGFEVVIKQGKALVRPIVR